MGNRLVPVRSRYLNAWKSYNEISVCGFHPDPISFIWKVRTKLKRNEMFAVVCGTCWKLSPACATKSARVMGRILFSADHFITDRRVGIFLTFSAHLPHMSRATWWCKKNVTFTINFPILTRTKQASHVQHSVVEVDKGSPFTSPREPTRTMLAMEANSRFPSFLGALSLVLGVLHTSLGHRISSAQWISARDANKQHWVAMLALFSLTGLFRAPSFVLGLLHATLSIELVVG